MDLQLEVEQVKKELVELIIVHLRENKIDVDKSRQLAADFLAVLPITDWQDLLNKLKTLGQKYKEAQELYVEEFRKVSDQKRNDALNSMRKCILQGNMDEAITVAKSLQTINPFDTTG